MYLFLIKFLYFGISTFIQLLQLKNPINLYMKILQAFVLLLAISAVSAEQLQLFSASTFIDSTSGVLTGSLLGGRTIYIKGIGFPTDPTTLQVFVGNYPCKIPADGLTSTTLSCQTSTSGGLTNIYNLPIKVIYNSEVITLSGYIYSYIQGDTPIIYDVYPSASTGDRVIQYIGRHRIVDKGDGQRDMGDFIGLYVGNQLCGLFDINQGEISYNGVNRVKCLQAREQQAGRYNVSQHVVAGWATKDWPVRKASLTNDFFEYTVLPGITQVNTNSGSPSGQDLIIKGTGFSKDTSKISVKVDGVNCAVSASSLTQISCRLVQKQTTDSAALNSNAATPTNQYLQGAGFKYERYNIDRLVNRNINGFKDAVKAGSTQISLIENSYVAELQTQDIYGTSYGQVFKGYFYAPVSGSYIFRGVSDDTFTLLISSEYGTTNSAMIEQIYQSTVGVSDQNHYISNHTSAIGNGRMLEGGKYYYMQAYHVNWAGPGYFKISVEVPNSDASLPKKRYQINHIETLFTNDPEIMTFTLNNAIGGSFNLSIYRVDPATLQVTYNKKVQLPYNASAVQFQNAINQFDLYSPYYSSCIDAKAFDASGNVVSLSSGLAINFEWTVSVYKLRTDSHLNQRFTSTLTSITAPAGATATFSQTRTRNHCPLLQGTFTMAIGGYPIRLWDQISQSYSIDAIPANVTAWTLMNALRQIAGFEKVDVYRTGDPAYGTKWFISYFQYSGNVPDIVVSGSGLTGGKSGTFPSIAAIETRAYSTNIVFNPVSEFFLFSASSQPSIIVEVNNIPSVCLTNCAYGFLPSTPVITSQSLSGSIVSITISNPQSYTIPLDWLVVKVDGKICQVISGGTFTSFTCQLPVNADGSPQLKAGLYDVDVLVMELGYLPVFSTVSKIHYQLAITSVIQPSGGINGGYEIIIKGKGFPDSAKGTKIMLCGVEAQIVSIQNTQAKILAPKCSTAGADTITIQYTNQTASGVFTYTNPTVSASLISISPKSASPVLKSRMTITGTGFGTNMSAINVHLSNSTGKVYRMRILQLNDTFIKCGIPGGLPGAFNVVVSIDGVGDIQPVDSQVDDFTYELLVAAVSPTTVAYYGGTLVTITGTNFSPDRLENLVHIGNQLNWLCEIQALTPSQIKCRVPETHPDWASPTQNIVINNRLILDSTCSGSCSLTYSDKVSSPQLTSLSATDLTSGSGTLFLYGSNLNLGTTVQVIFENKLTKEKIVLNPVSSSANSINVNIPSIQAGYYKVKARLDPVGDTNAIEVIVKGAVYATSTSASIKGGKIAVNGLGLPTQWPSKLFSIKLMTNSFYINPIISTTTSTKLQLQLPSGINSQWYLLTLTNPLEHSYSVNISHSTSSTPTIQILSSTAVPAGSVTVSLNRTNLATTAPTSIQMYNVLDPMIKTPISTWTTSGSVLSFTQTLKAGQYSFKVYYNGFGFADVQGSLDVSAIGTYTAVSTDVSLAGGQIVVTGSGISAQAIIKVGGFIGKAATVTATQATFNVPPLITPAVLQAYPELQKIQKIIPSSIISDTPLRNTYSFDGIYSSSYSSTNSICYIGIDAGQSKLISVRRLRFFPYHKWTIASQYILNAVFEASTDGVSYTEISKVDSTVHSGWNSLLINTNVNYRYIRLRHDSTSNCKIAEFQVHGVLLNNVPVSSLTQVDLDITVDDGFNRFVIPQVVSYKSSKTPVITNVMPDTVSVYGNQLVTITGQNLNLATAKVVIDNIQCIITGTPTPTNLQCTTQARPNLPQQSTFAVAIGANKAVIKHQILYVMRWSDIRTWGTDLPPVEGDLVYVPRGMSLYVDQSTPRLDGIIVEEGKLIFADEADMEVHSNSIILKKGQFRAGTQKKPYQNKLTFIMYGHYYGKQLPMFGNKGIGCMDCKFSMYGTPRPKTWTLLSSTIAPNTTILNIDDTVDWQVGEEIVVASTSFDHNQAEQRKIVAITGNQITVDKPFQFQHLGVIQSYGSNRLEMKAEVGLLTRNIKMMGDPSSEAAEYGSHLMLTGNKENGFIGHVAYTEFTHCGQPRILGRYCIHFHMNGDVPDSFAKGNAVHHSFARVITLHGVHFLTVSENVGYRVKGHNFFIEDGIQTQNLIEKNLAIGSLQSWNMGQTDISVASFWVTNPSNNLRFNRAAGGDFYGFWYEIKTHPDGPSATQDVCPIGNPLGESHDNVAHSYKRFGLRIFKLYSREKPCWPIRLDHLADPWSANPSIQSKFYNYLTYKNGEAGLLAEQVGNMIFQNFTIADSKRSGMQFYLTKFTKQLVIARDMAIIGLSTINGGNISNMNNSAGVIGPRSSGIKISNVRFYNFAPYMVILQTCSKCQSDLLFTNSGHQYMLQGISFTNVSSPYLHLNGMRRQIVYDLDGSFSQPFNALTRTSATLTAILPHLQQQSDCSLATNPTLWDNALICNQNVKIRKVIFQNLLPQPLFELTPLKVQLLSDVYQTVPQNSTAFTQFYSANIIYQIEPMVDRKRTYAIPFAAGRIYNIWWLTGLDFTHLNMDVSPQFYEDTDPAIIFKFNYTANRQLFEIGKLVNGRIDGNFSDVLINSTLDNTACELGDYTHDYDNQEITVCATSRGKSRPYSYLEIKGITCRYICPSETNQYVKQKFLRIWSNYTQWPGGVMPSPGDDVTIEGQWTILMDMEPVPIGNWIIKGDVIIPNNMMNVNIKANNIWIKSGALKAGTTSEPYTGNLIIELLGNKNDRHITINPQLSGNKLFVVTGRLQLYGQVPTTPWVRLTQMARPGDTQITVTSTAGWQIGDELGLACSFSATTQHQKATITGINGNTVTFTPALRYKHYGDSSPTITNAVGTLDTRAGVGLLTRNIKIVAGQDAGWGYHLIAYGYNDDITYNNMTILRSGNVVLQGVQLRQGGQYDTQKSALKLWNTVGNKSVSIYRSSFHNCKSYCIDIKNINNADIRQNVFFMGRVFIVRALTVRQYKFESNLMIAATKRPTMIFDQLIACYATYDAIHDVGASIRHNLCQGSDGNGIVLPYVPCQFADNPPYEDNTVGSAVYGFIFNKINTQCLAGSGMKAYACRIAHMQHSPGTITIMLSKLMVADSNRGITLRFGKQYDDSTAYFRNSYVSAISRPTCSECYGSDAIKCSHGRGVRMLSVTINGQSLPMFGDGFDIICRKETFDCKAFVDDVIFQNFNINYGELPQCYNNAVFEPHRLASDMTGTHHLHNTVCNNCSVGALARFTPPLPQHFGWAGGCGRIPCTGKNNYMIQDHTGHYIGQPGFLLANNTEIGSKTAGCTFVPEMNGHVCNRLDFGVLEYESIAPDFNTRIMWPVYLQYEGGIWNTTTNGWREWEWDGNQPLNLRHARFVSIVQVNKVYNMTFESQPPIDMRFQFQRRTATGNNSQYIVVKLHYPRPNSIRVMNRGTVMKPISLLDNNGENPLNIGLCGSNKFFYQNYTVHFVITADRNCQVRVSLTNSIQLTARFSMDINDFYANDGQTKFIDRVCAVLGIVDTSRLKIVGIYNGSVIIHAYIDEELNTTIANATQNNNDLRKSQIIALGQLLASVYENGTLNTEFESVGFGPLLEFQFQNFYHTYDSVDEATLSELAHSTKALVIGVSVAACCLLVAIIAGALYIRKKAAKIQNVVANKSQVKIEETMVDTAYSQDGWK